MKLALWITMCFVVGLLLGHVAAQQYIRTQDLERSTENMRRLNDALELPPYRNETWCRLGKICEDEAVQSPIVWIANQEEVRKEEDTPAEPIHAQLTLGPLLFVDRYGIWQLLDDCHPQDSRDILCGDVDQLRNKLKVQLQDQPCLAQMEAAMRAMDDYIYTPANEYWSNSMTLEMCGRLCMAEK